MQESRSRFDSIGNTENSGSETKGRCKFSTLSKTFDRRNSFRQVFGYINKKSQENIVSAHTHARAYTFRKSLFAESFDTQHYGGILGFCRQTITKRRKLSTTIIKIV